MKELIIQYILLFITLVETLRKQYLHRFKLMYLYKLYILTVKLHLFICLYALAGLVGGALLGSK